MNVYRELEEALAPVVRAGDLARCERMIAEGLASLPSSPFHIVIDLSISNSPAAVGKFFDGFFREAVAQFSVAAAYTEMNGFDVNPKRWFCNVFAYQECGGHEDYDWLSDWKFESDDLTITGLEQLQGVYASGALSDKRFTDAGYVAGLLVLVKFQDLIRRAAPQMSELRFPLFVTAHDYDLILAIRPEK